MKLKTRTREEAMARDAAEEDDAEAPGPSTRAVEGALRGKSHASSALKKPVIFATMHQMSRINEGH